MINYLNLETKSLKLKRHLNRKDKVSGQEFFRFDITLSPDMIKELGWKAGQELKASVKNDKLVIEKE